MPTIKLLQICSQFVNKLYSHCFFQVIGTSCKQLVATYKVVLTNLMPSRCNKNVTRQTKQVCNNIVMMTVSVLLKQPCNKSDNIKKLVTSCYQLVPNLLTTCTKPCEHNLLTACWQTCCKLWDFCSYTVQCCSAICIIYLSGQLVVYLEQELIRSYQIGIALRLR